MVVSLACTPSALCRTLLGPDAKPLFYKDRTVAKIVQMMLQGESAGKEERTPAPSKSKSKADVVAGEPASTGKKRNQKASRLSMCFKAFPVHRLRVPTANLPDT